MREESDYPYFEDVNLGLLRLWGNRRGLKVLDVGCGYATTSARIQELGNEVAGIEESAGASAVASSRLARVIRADLQDLDAVGQELGDQQFDALIFADVLEHLAWPLGVLRRYLRWLRADGSVFISLPNVGLWSVRLAHFAGRWNYQETGVLDRTHLRFFTRRSAVWLVEEAGLEPARITYNPGLLRPLVPLVRRLASGNDGHAPDPAGILNSAPYRVYTKVFYPVERLIASAWPGMLAFQMIYETRRKR